MRISKFIKVDQDVLLEWIYDDDNFLIEDYTIINDTIQDTRAFSNALVSNNQESETYNYTDNQLFLLDRQKNKWGIVDSNPETNRYYYLQFQDYSGNVPHRYDIVRLHFPVDYTFKDKLGCLMNINLYNRDQTIKFPISNYYYDKTDPNRTDLQFSSPPFMFQEKLWGKHIELQVPSPYALIKDVSYVNQQRLPRQASIHKNLVEEDINVLSNETPIFIDFQFLTKNETKLSQEYYYTNEPFSTTIPVVPEFEQLGVVIDHSSQGDMFEIYGTYNNNSSQFNDFIQEGFLNGNRYYVIYEVSIYEKNVRTTTQSFSLFDNFDVPIDFRPIIKYSTTTAIIDVTMKLINSSDDSTILRKASYSMIQDEVSKYSLNLTKINIQDTYKPKIYNAKPDNLNITMGSGLQNTKKVEVPVVVMFERLNITVKNVSDNINNTTYYGQGLQQILLVPSDNVLKFAVGNGTDDEGIIPFQFPTDTPCFLRFKSSKSLVEIPLYWESNQVDLKRGLVVFKILETQVDTISAMYDEGYDQFYIVLKSNSGTTTTVYSGRFLIYDKV